MEDAAYRELMNYALRALARRALTRFELEEKLKKRREHTPEKEAVVLSRLEELGLINDQDYIRRALEEASQYRLQGRLKVASRLYRKGISPKDTEAAWDAMGLSEKDLALEALARAHKRFAKVSADKLYRRRAQFLASRGFSPEIIFELARTDENH